MNSIDFNKNDFPLTTNVLKFMQDSLQLVEKIAGIISENYILSGCEVVGFSNNAGFVVVNGEIMPFAGGMTQTYVRVISTSETINVQDGTYTKTSKQLVFGTGSGQITWSTFKRASEIIENRTLLAKRVISIGTWNMKTTATKDVSLAPTTLGKVRSVQVMIYDDGSGSIVDIRQSGSFIVGPANLTLSRIAGGFFAASDIYQSVLQNRGYIVIDYIQ